MPTHSAAMPMHLTPRQRQILEAISASQQNRCCSPTLAELAAELDISRSTVFEHIAELRAKGLITIYPGKARSSRLTSQGQRLLSRFNAEDGDIESGGDARGIPLAGQVAAGQPINAIEERQTLSWASLFGSGESLFSLQVNGDSMIEEDIHSGDYVICRRTNVASDGELVVARVNEEEATLKRFHKETHRIRLQPANSAYEPIYTDNCQIEGVVVGLVRRV